MSDPIFTQEQRETLVMFEELMHVLGAEEATDE